MKRFSRPSRAPAKLAESTNRHLNMYTLAATAAGVGVFALAPPAEARIVYTHIHRIIGPYGYALDLNHDRKVDFTLRIAGGGDPTYTHSSLTVEPYGLYSGNGIITTAMGTGGRAIALRAGARIGSHKLFNQRITVLAGHGTVRGTRHYTYWFGQWANGGKGLKNRFLGLKFLINGTVHFGWARFTVTTKGRKFTGILTGYAYETIPNKLIVAGKTTGSDNETSVGQSDPSPLTAPVAAHHTLGMLALGAEGVPLWRRRKSVDATQ